MTPKLDIIVPVYNEGKNILFINSGGKKKKFALETAKKMGATITLAKNPTGEIMLK